MKTCKFCKTEKPLTFFHKQKDGKFGCRPECKDCANAIDRQKNYKVSVEFKICNSCQVLKSQIEFTKRKKSLDGLNSKCKKCYAEYIKCEKIKQKRNVTVNNRRKNDSNFKLKELLRSRLYKATKAKSWKKNTKFNEYIGCTLEELKLHLEKQFTEGMSWDNQGEWHIDHIIPLNSATTEEEMYKLCHYTNLQPMWASDNIRKSDKDSGDIY